MTLEGDRQAKNHGLQLIIKKLALCKDDALVKKLAPSLINHYFLQLHSSPNRSGINDPDFFALVYRTGNQKLIKKLLDDFAMAEYTATYITLANLGDEKLIKSTLDKNWNKLKLSGNVKLSPDGLACAEKVCAAIKEPEEKYIAKVLFATPRVYRKDKDGKINYRQYNVQSAAFTKLANEFGNIKFSSKTNEIFCLQSLLSIHSDAGKIIAEKIPEKFLAFDVDTLVRLRNYNLSRQAGQVYFNCLMSGNSQAVFEKIKRLVELSRSSDNGIKNSVRNMLRGCSDAFFSKNLQEIKTEQVNDLAHLLLLLFNNMEDGYKAYPQSAFLIYLAGKQDELIKKLKSTPDNRRRVQTYLWNNQLRYMKSFCEKNKLEPRQKITDFLNSHLAREIFKNNAAALTEVQTSFVRESSDSFAGFKTYYDSLRANNKCSVNMINQFYSKLGQFIRKEYRRLKGNNRNQSPEAMRILFENYDKAFRDSDFTIRYNCLQLFTNLSKSQMRELINKRKALKNKSKSALRLDNILQAYLERNQSRRISPETTEKMWNDIKGLPENWRTALGLVLFRQRGGETLSRFLVAPVVKMVKDRKLASFYLRGLIYNIAIIDDKTLLKKIAPPLVDFYLGMVDKWDDNNCKNNRMAIAMSLNLAYRIDYIEQVKKFIAYPKINKYADVYICLANAGAEDILREALDKNWRGLSWPSRIVLFPDAAVLGRKLSAGFQKAEKKYISSVLFAGPAVYRQNKNGDINRYSSRGQKKLLKRLTMEFGKIEFSSVKNKIFCLTILLNRRENYDLLAKKSADKILSIPLAEIADNEDNRFHNQIGSFYFVCSRFGKIKPVTEKVRQLVKLYETSENRLKHRVRNILHAFDNAYRSFNLRNIKTADAKAFADLGLVMFSGSININRSLPWNAAFFSYLAEDQNTFIAALKKIPANKRNFYSGNWSNCLRNIEHFCKSNDLDCEKVIMGFLDSPLIKELYQNKMNNINNIRKNIARRFVKKAK